MFERHGLKISRTKAEYLPSPTNETENTVMIIHVDLHVYNDILQVARVTVL